MVIRAANSCISATSAAASVNEGAKHRFTDEGKEQSVKMRAEGMSLSATVRMVGASAPTVSEWVKKGGIGYRASDALSGVADKRSS